MSVEYPIVREDHPDLQPVPHATSSLATIPRQGPEIAQAGLFGTNEPLAVVQKATAVATALKDVIRSQGLISSIQGREYPKVEAWTLLGTMLGIFPVLVWTKPVEGGWEARVEAKTRDGSVIGAAEAQCLKSEKNWANRDDFALRSMAQTRATAKCLRMPLGFVMTLAGYEATPAEEMPYEPPKAPKVEKLVKTPPSPVSAPPQGVLKPSVAPPATTETRARMVERLLALENVGEDLILEYFRKLASPAVLLDTEGLADIPLQFVPVTKAQFESMKSAILDFAVGHEAKHGFPPNTITPAPVIVAGAPSAASPSHSLPEAPRTSGAYADEPWYSVIVPVPNKGQRRDEYLKNPDTIGSLYLARHGNDEESATARRRLWGFVNNYEPKGWKKTNGQEMPPSKADILFREALDQFVEYFEKAHPDEKL